MGYQSTIVVFGESDELFQKLCNDCGILKRQRASQKTVAVNVDWGLDVLNRYTLQQQLKQVSKGVSLRKTKVRRQRSHPKE
jgi:hypothetical protein